MTQARTKPLPTIEHIVVVMLENRSFDSMLGRLYPDKIASGEFNGLTGNEYNEYHDLFSEKKIKVSVSATPPSGHSPYLSPDPDPGEFFGDMTQQILNEHDGKPGTPMGGFAQNYHDIPQSGTAGDVLTYFDPQTSCLPITNALALNGAVCDQWFASGPVQTFPNRMFCHCATPGLHLIDKHKSMTEDTEYFKRPSIKSGYLGSIPDKSVFELFGETPLPQNWKIYFHDTSLSAINQFVFDAWNSNSGCVVNYDNSDYIHIGKNTDASFNTFAQDVENDTLPKYAFIEPRYFDDYSGSGLPSNSNHPGKSSYNPFKKDSPVRNVLQGELFLYDVFDTLASNQDVFNKTLLIVTYDEHGGIYDHVMPNSGQFNRPAPSPFEEHEKITNFKYDRYGVRVPTLFLNPAIPKETIFRTDPSSPYPFDHTSIIATLCQQFDLAGPLTPRDHSAPLITGLIPENPTYRCMKDLFSEQKLKELMASCPKVIGNAVPAKSIEEHNQMMVERLENFVKLKNQAVEKNRY